MKCVCTEERIDHCAQCGRALHLSAPFQITEQGWSTWQLYSFDGHKDHLPHIPPPTHPATWAKWYWEHYKQDSIVSWNYESAACPPDIYSEWMSLHPTPQQEEHSPTDDSAQDAWSVAS